MQGPAPVVTRSSSPSSHGPSSSTATGRPEAGHGADPEGAVTEDGIAGQRLELDGLAAGPMRRVVLTGSAGAQSASPAWRGGEGAGARAEGPQRATLDELTRAARVDGHREAGAGRRRPPPRLATEVTPSVGSSVMDWLAGAMTMLVLTGSAAAQSASPAWLAVRVQVPAPGVTCGLASSHGPSASNTTGRPEPLVAPSSRGASPKVTAAGSGSSSMDWLAGAMTQGRADRLGRGPVGIAGLARR